MRSDGLQDKVIVDKSRDEVSLLEQDTIENVSSPIKNQKENLNFIFAPENMKKPLTKVAHNWPRPFFSVLSIGQNSAQISIPIP